MKRIHYIYRIVNIRNRKSYVGYTIDIDRRWKTHLRSSTTHSDKPLYHAMRKYGINNFYLEILSETYDKDFALKILEPYYIKYYDSKIDKNGYNLTDGGESNYGWVPSEKTKSLWKKQRKGKVVSESCRLQTSARMKANPPMHNPAVRAKVSKTLKERGIRPILTAEVKESKRLRQIGKPIHSDERKQYLSNLFKSYNPMCDPNIREKARANKKGKGVGVANGNAKFCSIINPEGKIINSGHLATICKEHDFPFNKFLANSREPRAIQRGDWKGWNIVPISKPSE